MPIHDWSRVRAGTFHFFHQRWIQDLAEALNMGGLPPGYFAMSEQDAKGPIPDVLALKGLSAIPDDEAGGVAVAEAPPKARVTSRVSEAETYARRADRITVNLDDGAVVAVIKIVSPGNKDSANAMRAFTRKAGDILRRRIHLFVIDLFPPTVRDPHGIHPAIWDQFVKEPFELPPSQPFTVASYSAAGREKVAYVENMGLGEPIPEMPLFLTPERYVPCPMEASYQETWRVFPQHLRTRIENPPAM
jgi:Protein of unknown function (DUF4058)